VPGIVRKVRVELGDRVEAGGALFELESIQVGEIQAELQTAREGVRTATANLARRRELVANGLTSSRQVDLAEQDLINAQAHASAAQAGLRLLGAGRASTSGRYTLVAPIAGTVVRRPAVLGILATEDTSLATIADTSVMWALCDVPESSAALIAPGQTMQLAIDGDAVVTTGAVLLRTEIMPGSIGAGCCEVEPPGGR